MVKEPKMCVVLSPHSNKVLVWVFPTLCSVNVACRTRRTPGYYQSWPLIWNRIWNSHLWNCFLFSRPRCDVLKSRSVAIWFLFFHSHFQRVELCASFPPWLLKKMLNWNRVTALMSFSAGLWSKTDALHIPHLIYYNYRILTCSFKRLILGSIN